MKTMPLSRSQQMARIRGKHTDPEVLLRRGLREAGLRYRIDVSTPAGRVDLLLLPASDRVGIFLDGCFWHGCPEHYVAPRSRIEFWTAKLAENVARDSRQTLAGKKAGWTILRFWEHEVFEDAASVVARIQAALSGRRRRTRDWRVFKVEWLDDTKELERRWMHDLRAPDRVRTEERRRQTRKIRSPLEAVRRAAVRRP